MTELGRWLFGLALMLSWMNSALHILWSDRPFYLMSSRVLQGRAPRAALIAAITLPFAALVVGFVRTQDWRIAIAILVAMAALRRWEIAQWPGDIVVRLGKYVPTAACLMAWLVTRALTGGSDHLGWNAACGVMGGIYLLAGIAKVRESGAIWVHPRYQALLVAERAFTGPRVLRGLRWWVARSTVASTVVGLAGLIIEFAGVLFVFPVLRPALAGAIVSLHIGFVLLLGYIEVEWTVVILAITLLAG